MTLSRHSYTHTDSSSLTLGTWRLASPSNRMQTIEKKEKIQNIGSRVPIWYEHIIYANSKIYIYSFGAKSKKGPKRQALGGWFVGGLNRIFTKPSGRSDQMIYKFACKFV